MWEKKNTLGNIMRSRVGFCICIAKEDLKTLSRMILDYEETMMSEKFTRAIAIRYGQGRGHTCNVTCTVRSVQGNRIRKYMNAKREGKAFSKKHAIATPIMQDGIRHKFTPANN